MWLSDLRRKSGSKILSPPPKITTGQEVFKNRDMTQLLRGVVTGGLKPTEPSPEELKRRYTPRTV
jgi:hypothetical protein